MNRGNHLDSIMRRVKLTDQNSPGTRFEFDREEAPSVPSASKCVVEEIYEEIPHDIMEERDAKVVERQGGDNNATPDIPEAREQTESLLSRESLASSAMFETEVGRGEEERVEYSDGSVYEGDVVMVDGKVVRHGQGTYKDVSRNATYTGSFRYDVVEGRARAVMADGRVAVVSIYEGSWVAGNPEGEGRATYPNGGEFQGEFEAGMRSGWGVMTFEGGDVFSGFWADDKIHGSGRWTHADGSYYQGTFEEGSRVRGKLVSQDGEEVYDGAWRGQARHGRGRAKLNGLGMYDGEWCEDVPHGQGTMRYVDGSEYVGAFAGGRRHGQGTMKHGNGDSYAGEWSDDAMHGNGYLIEDGNTYAGAFVEGRRQGQGSMKYADGSAYVGAFTEGRPHGQGTMKYADGSVYRGEFVRGRRHGHGKCKFQDGTTFKGAWDDDGWVQTAADAARSKVAGAGIVRAEAGKTAKFLIQARDVLGNKRLSGGDDFQVVLVRHDDETDGEIDAQIIDAINVRDMEDGTYEVTYIANVAGVYELSVLCRDAHTADSPYPVRVLPGPAVFARTLVSGVKSAARPGDTMEFEIRARDRFGNMCTSDPDADGPLEVLLDGSGDCVKVVRAGDGRVVVRITIEEEEDSPKDSKVLRLLRVLLGGRDVPGTPFSIVCGNRAEGEAEDEAEGEAEGEVEDEAEGEAARDHPEFPRQERIYAGARRVERSKWDAFVFEDDEDGDGWDSEPDESRKGELSRGDKVPVVENLEDLWLVSKLQQERKAKEAQEKKSRVEAMRRTLEASFEKDSEDKADDFRAFLGTMYDGVAGEKVKEREEKEAQEKKSGVVGGSGSARSLARAARALEDV